MMTDWYHFNNKSQTPSVWFYVNFDIIVVMHIDYLINVLYLNSKMRVCVCSLFLPMFLISISIVFPKISTPRQINCKAVYIMHNLLMHHNTTQATFSSRF